MDMDFMWQGHFEEHAQQKLFEMIILGIEIMILIRILKIVKDRFLDVSLIHMFVIV